VTPDEFLDRFFAAPNGVWPGLDPQHPAASSIMPFLGALPVRGECPVVLPRRDLRVQPFVLYVICWDTAHAGRIRSLLEAAVAHQYCGFDGRVARLNGNDPIDAAVLELVGDGSTFVLRPQQHTQGPIVRAMARLVRSLSDMPLRNPQLPRPVGRMLREFDLALAAGEAVTSASLLKEIEGVGGISHQNVAFLRIRRLSQLGLEAEVLAHPSMPTMVVAEPPRLVREAVLGAWARVDVLPTLPLGPDEALARLSAAAVDYALLVDERIGSTADPDVATLGALVALARNDAGLVQVFSANKLVDPSVAARLAQFGSPASPGAALVEESVPEVSPVTTEFAEEPVCASWLDWTKRVAADEASSVGPGDADEWAPAWTVDAALAAAIDDFGDVSHECLIPGISLFLETDDPEHPAGASASALITRYLFAEWFRPADLGALGSLLQIFLRSAPPVAAYQSLLGDIQSYAARWVSVASAVRVLDIADAVVCGPAVDSDTRVSLITTLLSPLHEQRHRLTQSDRLLGELIASDVGLHLDWTTLELDEEAASEAGTVNPAILLYSLDSGSLQRTTSAIERRWPEARVQVSAAKVGDQSLKQHARNADIVVLATRRAAHAATNFIQANKGEQTEIVFPDGSGSASMMRVLETAVMEWRSARF
jgi:hypothetical protein